MGSTFEDVVGDVVEIFDDTVGWAVGRAVGGAVDSTFGGTVGVVIFFVVGGASVDGFTVSLAGGSIVV